MLFKLGAPKRDEVALGKVRETHAEKRRSPSYGDAGEALPENAPNYVLTFTGSSSG